MNTIWAPLQGSQSYFLKSLDLEILYHGTRGGGKTDALLMSFAQFVGIGFGSSWKGVIFRTQAADLNDLIDKSEQWFYLLFPGAHYNRGRSSWRFPTGEQLLFRHIYARGDYYKYHGHSYPFIGWEELTTWKDDNLYKMMISCCRSSNPYVPKMIRSTTNPYGVGHNWVKDRFQIYGDFKEPKEQSLVDGTKRVALYSHMSENSHLMRATPNYENMIKDNCENESQLKAWLLGSWEIVAGGLFSDVWDYDIHVIEPFAIPPSWTIDRSFDWGSSAPFSVGWWAESDGTPYRTKDGRVVNTLRGDLFRIMEWYGWSGRPNVGLEMLAKDIAQGIRQREYDNGLLDRVHSGVADASIFTIENGHCIAHDMQNHVTLNHGQRVQGVWFDRSDKRKGTRVLGWQLMRERLKNAITRAKKQGPLEFQDGNAMYIFSNCLQFCRTIPVLMRSERYIDDIDTNVEDHIADETRYRLLATGSRIKVFKSVGHY